MRRLLAIFKSPRAIPYVGIGMAVFVWLFDTLIDHFMFRQQAPLLESFWPDEPMELWMRLLVVGLFLVLSWYARMLLNSEAAAREELESYRTHLEKIVADRTRELQANVEALEKEMNERQRVQAELETLAITDPLTQLYNRRKFLDLLEQEFLRYRRYPTEFAVILFDIDHFKEVNDRCGHDVGDAVLRHLAETVRHHLRRSDIVARWGGEEFILFVPESDADIALAIAEKLRSAIQGSLFPSRQQITISLGVAVVAPGDAPDSLIKRADNGLYRAKHEGRNRVALELPNPSNAVTRIDASR